MPPLPVPDFRPAPGDIGIGLMLGLAASAQAVLALGADAAPAVAIGALVAGAWTQRARIGGLDVLLVTVALGGLAMALAPGLAQGHAHGGHGALAAALPMVAVCVGGCGLWCPPPCRADGRLARVGAHAVVAAAMVAGMLVGAALAPDAAPGGHLAMVAGMGAGAVAGLAAVRLAERARN